MFGLLVLIYPYLPYEKSLEKYGSMGIAIPGGKFSLIDVNGEEITEPELVGELIEKRELTVSVLHSNARWFGMTYQEDKPMVAQELQKLHDAGVYPQSLR